MQMRLLPWYYRFQAISFFVGGTWPRQMAFPFLPSFLSSYFQRQERGQRTGSLSCTLQERLCNFQARPLLWMQGYSWDSRQPPHKVELWSWRWLASGSCGDPGGSKPLLSLFSLPLAWTPTWVTETVLLLSATLFGSSCPVAGFSQVVISVSNSCSSWETQIQHYNKVSSVLSQLLCRVWRLMLFPQILWAYPDHRDCWACT